MELSYWTSRWRKGKTGFHLDRIHPLLIEYSPRLELRPGDTVLVPLCGKSLDLTWLADRGFDVHGVEISEIAIRKFFEEQGLSFEREQKDSFTLYKAGHITIWQGDFFKLKRKELPEPAAVYDRAALVAMPPAKREKYARKVMELAAETTRQLILTFDYQQREMPGPPFSVPFEEVKQFYGSSFTADLLVEKDRLDKVQHFRRRGLKSRFIEQTILLTPVKSVK